MAFTIPNRGAGDNDVQSVVFSVDLDILQAGISGIDCVLSGCAITGGADMTPAVAKGAVLSNGTLFAVAAADVTITTADGTNPRIDLIVVNSSGALAVRAGTAAASPVPPSRTANDVVLGMVWVPASDTAIATTQIIDKRVFRTQGPIRIAKSTTNVTFTNSTSVQEYFVVTIPNGLFLSGRVLRCRAYGTCTNTSGSTMGLTPSIQYGGSTLWADGSAAALQVSDAVAWIIDCDLVAQADATQILGGHVGISESGTVTTGTGPLDTVAMAYTPIYGTLSIDSDSANRDFKIRWTMSGANATLTCRGATLELL
jgi:hypothetical protein